MFEAYNKDRKKKIEAIGKGKVQETEESELEKSILRRTSQGLSTFRRLMTETGVPSNNVRLRKVGTVKDLQGVLTFKMRVPKENQNKIRKEYELNRNKRLTMRRTQSTLDGSYLKYSKPRSRMIQKLPSQKTLNRKEMHKWNYSKKEYFE
mmetsp:Transcript_15954/g.13931  ORF Transcript_15954/g.13931 Transcript_15954/m.13931 type:complete len:150 (+) Transcript_15954:841-1290(+)